MGDSQCLLLPDVRRGIGIYSHPCRRSARDPQIGDMGTCDDTSILRIYLRQLPDLDMDQRGENVKCLLKDGSLLPKHREPIHT